MTTHFSTSRKLLMLLGALAVLASVLVLAAHRIEQHKQETLDSERIEEKRQFVEEVIRLSGESLEAFANDYSRWDEMVAFVKRPNSPWARLNVDPSLNTYRADVVWALDSNSSVVYAATLPTSRTILLDKRLSHVLTETALAQQFFHYYLHTSCGLLEIRGAPVQPTADMDRVTKPAGHLVVGRIWGEQRLAAMARELESRLTLATSSDSLIAAVGQAGPSRPEGYHITFPLNGPDGTPEARLSAIFYSPTAATLHSEFRAQLGLFIISIIILLTTFGFLLRRWVAGPLNLVLSGLAGEHQEGLEKLKYDRSEFGIIAQRILASNAERLRLRENEEVVAANDRRTRTIVELSGQVLYDTNTVTGEVILMGPVEKITAYPMDEFPGRSLEGWHKCVHPDDRERVSRLRQETMHSESPLSMEYRVQRKDGSYVTVEQSGCIIRDSVGATHLIGTIKDISSRRAAEDALKDSEHFLSSIVENIPTMLFVKTAEDLRFLIFNRVGAEMLGHSVEDFVGKNDYDFFRPEDADFFTASDRAVLQQRVLVDIPEENISTRTGGNKILHTKKIPILDRQGNPRYLLGISEDITEKKLFEQKLTESENKFRTIFDHAPDATLLFERTIVDCNEKASVLFGYSREELMQKSFGDLAPEVQPDGHTSRELEAEQISLARQGKGTTFFWKVQNRWGGTIDTEITLNTLKIDGQAMLLASIRDISRRRTVEEQLRLLATAVAQSAEGLVITDLTGSIQYVNPAFERMTQYKSDEVIGKNPRILRSGKQDAGFYEDLWSTLLSGRTWQGRLENKKKDGSTYLENTSISPVFDAAGACTHFVAVKRDVSHEVALEAMFLQSQKMEAIGRLAGGVAHDFNNILTAILGYSDILVRRLVHDETLRSDAEEIKKAATRASGLTKQLLAFSRRQTIQKQSVNLYRLVTDMGAMLEQLVGEGVNLRLSCASDDLLVFADPTHLQQILLNLAVNAKDAMPMGGNLEILIFEESSTSRRSVGKSELPPGDYIVLQTSDTGKGMDESVLSHLFEPFFTTKEIGKGTGLGLATVFGIVEQTGGAVEVSSEVGVGTTFRIHLPRSTPPLPPRHPSIAEASMAAPV